MSYIRTNNEWLSIIHECRASGLSDKVWCRQNGISSSAFYYNIRKLRKLSCAIPASSMQSTASETHEIVPLKIEEDVALQPATVSTSEQSCTDRLLSIRIECNGILVSCPDGISPAMICSVIRALRTEC